MKINNWGQRAKARCSFGVELPLIVISKSIQTKNNCECVIEYLDRVIKPLVLIFPKMSGYVKTFKDKGGDKN